jgi:hypothetical protein
LKQLQLDKISRSSSDSKSDKNSMSHSPIEFNKKFDQLSKQEIEKMAIADQEFKKLRDNFGNIINNPY